ncbi:MAG: hypothetical protein GX222_00720 [Ruminococcaceae bacterium]|nr:hypothetical protein [Oscillospiraceae bacterium]
MNEKMLPKNIENILALAADMMSFEQDDRLAQLVRMVKNPDGNEMYDEEMNSATGDFGNQLPKRKEKQ